MSELYRQYRPNEWEDVLGQPEAVHILQKKLEEENVPHAILFHGPTGCGKTTIARITSLKLGCSEHDYCEYNTANYRGIDVIRELTQTAGQLPFEGKVRVWTFDECHKMTVHAQNSMLKLLEEPPDHAFFFLCTTEPEKLIRTLQSRCMRLYLKPLKREHVFSVLRYVCTEERISISKDVAEQIVDAAEGSAREALQIVDKIRHLPKSKMSNAIQKSSLKLQTIELARLLLAKATWPRVAALLKEIQEEDCEQVRRLVLAYMTKVLLSGKKSNVDRAFRCIQLFMDNTYDCGWAGIVAASYEVAMG